MASEYFALWHLCFKVSYFFSLHASLFQVLNRAEWTISVYELGKIFQFLNCTFSKLLIASTKFSEIS